jgi:tetratricopeptide (TPR) repeat protein
VTLAVGLALALAVALGARDAVRRVRTAEIPALPKLDRVGEPVREQLTLADAAARNRPGSGDALGALAMAYHANAFNEPARVLYRAASRADAGDDRWPYLLGVLEITAGENERAVTFLLEAIARREANAHAWARLGQLYYRQSKAPESERALRRALEIDPEHPHAAVDLSRLLGERGQWADAARVLEPSLRAHANFGPAHRMAALAYRNLGRTADEKRHEELGSDIGLPMLDPLVQALYDQSSTGSVLLTQGQMAQNWGDMTRAQALLSRAVRVAPSDRDVRLAMGRFLMAAGGGDPEAARAALAHFTAAVELDRSYVASRHDQASAMLALRDTTGAVRVWLGVLHEEPAHAMAYMALGDVEFARKRFAEARERYEAGLAVAPDTPFRLGNRAQGYQRLGATYAALGRVDEASRAYATAASESMTKAEITSEWARMLREHGREGAAEEVFQRAIAEDRADPRLRLAFGNYLLQARRFGPARAELAESVRLNPSDASAHAALGYVLLEEGELEGAVASLRRSIELRPDSPLAHYHLGNAYLRRGEADAARAAYQTALLVRPGFRPAQEALLRLSR